MALRNGSRLSLLDEAILELAILSTVFSTSNNRTHRRILRLAGANGAIHRYLRNIQRANDSWTCFQVHERTKKHNDRRTTRKDCLNVMDEKSLSGFGKVALKLRENRTTRRSIKRDKPAAFSRASLLLYRKFKLI